MVTEEEDIAETVQRIHITYTSSRFQIHTRKVLMKPTLVLIYASGAPMRYLVQKGYFDSISNSVFAVRLMHLDETQFTRFDAGAIFIAVPIVTCTSACPGSWPPA